MKHTNTLTATPMKRFVTTMIVVLAAQVATADSPTLTVKTGLVCWYDAAVGVSVDDQGCGAGVERPLGQRP